jgi:hypothetical protein
MTSWSCLPKLAAKDGDERRLGVDGRADLGAERHAGDDAGAEPALAVDELGVEGVVALDEVHDPR